MTENEALEKIGEKYMNSEYYFAENDEYEKNFDEELHEAYEVAMGVLKEIQQYRALGTVEELRGLIAKGKAYEQVAWERNVAISQLEEIGCSLGQKMDEAKEAMEKQREKKRIKGKIFKTVGYYQCPVCGGLLTNNQKYCDNCGQAIDWSEEE